MTESALAAPESDATAMTHETTDAMPAESAATDAPGTESPPTEAPTEPEPAEPERGPEPADSAEAIAADELDELRRKVSELSGRLDRLNAHEQRVMDAERFVAACEAEVNRISAELKEAKKEFDSAVSELRREIKNRDGQGELPFRDAPPEGSAEPADPSAFFAITPAAESEPRSKPVDDACGATPLTQIGLTSSQSEKLAGLDPAVENVAQLEALISSGGFVPGRIKGLGETAINKISDKLTAFRAEHPGKSEQAPELVDGAWDGAQFFAGRIARSHGKTLADNPHTDESHAAASWSEGWKLSESILGEKPVEVHGDDEVGDALFLCDEIVELAADLPDAAESFASSVTETAIDIKAWIEEHQHVTDDQFAALQNMRAGIDRWHHA